ncbi:MAG: hypothetical protein ACI88H_003765 [Cocleimonas sp.]|jgi:hypothetical protein
MPFTISHIVAAIPLNNGLCKNSKISKYTALSPLIIGSMTPDIAYLTPFLVHQRVDSHSLLGIYLFCIPMGLTIYFLYHLLMAPVLVSFFPKKIQQHLNPDLFIGKLPTISSHLLLISIILGALTHIIWDFFTHQSGIPQHLLWMNTPLVNIDGYDIMPYRMLQHLSSVLGLALLLYWIIKWYRRVNVVSKNHYYWQAPRALKIFGLTMLALGSLVAGMINGYLHLPNTDVLFGLYSAQVFIRYAIVGGMGAFLLCCCALGLLYQISIKMK